MRGNKPKWPIYAAKLHFSLQNNTLWSGKIAVSHPNTWKIERFCVILRPILPV